MSRPTSQKPVGLSALTGGALNAGFTLLELLVTVAIIAIIGAFAMPAISSFHGESSLKAVVYEIAGMLREAKRLALTHEKYYAVSFNTDTGRISLVSERGNDGKWNTADDGIVRSFRLAEKGGGLRFGYGSCGPIPGNAETSDGVTFQTNNTAVCNPDLTGNAGTVYLESASGAAMAIVMNSKDFGYALWRWSGGKWMRM